MKRKSSEILNLVLLLGLDTVVLGAWLGIITFDRYLFMNIIFLQKGFFSHDFNNK